MYQELKDLAQEANVTDVDGINKYLDNFMEKELKYKKKVLKKIMGEL